MFQARAQLASGEVLRKCPQCNSHARCNMDIQQAICLNESCEYIFCGKCREAYHGVEECLDAANSSKRSRVSGPVVGSHQSRKNLKRL